MRSSSNRSIGKSRRPMISKKSSSTTSSSRLSLFLQLNSESSSESGGSFYSTRTSSSRASKESSNCFTPSTQAAVSIDYTALHNFVHKMLLSHCRFDSDDPELIRILVKSIRDKNIENITFCLTTILDCQQTLPAEVVADIHSFVGQMYLKQRDYRSAVSSLLRVLWMQRCFLARNVNHNTNNKTQSGIPSSRNNHDNMISSKAVSRQRYEIAKTEHRLGLTYGYQGDFAKAIGLLEQALVEYDQAGVVVRDACYASAREALGSMKEAEQLEKVPEARRCARYRSLSSRSLAA